MKKLYYVLIAISALALGVGLYFLQPQIPILSSITNFFKDAYTFVQTQIQNVFGTTNPKTVLAAASAVATPAILGIKALYNKLKKNQQVASNLIQDLRSDLTQENTLKNQFQAEKQTLEQQASELKTGIANVQSQMQQQKTHYENAISEMEKELIALRAQKNEALTILNAVKNPTVEDLKRKLQQEGFTVIKKVP